jgi:hypothetical protein
LVLSSFRRRDFLPRSLAASVPNLLNERDFQVRDTSEFWHWSLEIVLLAEAGWEVGMEIGLARAGTRILIPKDVARVGNTTKNVVEVPLGELTALHPVPRPGMPPNHIDNLALRIAEDGYQVNQAIPVLRMPSGKLVTAGGHHRVAAMARLGESTVPARIVEWSSLSPQAQARYLQAFGSVLRPLLK